MILSIITVVKNDIKGLERTFRSIEFYTSSKDIEWIVIDGESNDGTKDFLSEIQRENFKWVSEKDKNMYDAMNKGVNMANGKYLNFLNAGDVLICNLENAVLSTDNYDIIFCNQNKIDKNNVRINWTLPDNYLESLHKYPSIMHQATLIKRDFMLKLNGYDDNYKYLGDYDFFVRALNKHIDKPTFVDRTNLYIVEFQCVGVTFQYEHSLKILKEIVFIQKKYYNKVNVKTYLLFVFKYLISFIPNNIEIINKMRYIIKR